MALASIISERLGKLELFSASPEGAETMVNEFVAAEFTLGCSILQEQLQKQLEAAEAKYSGARQRRSKRYHTLVGSVELTRRIYSSKGGECLGEQALGLTPRRLV
ncbi:MAG: hypothetical protein AAF921_11725 [Cyanobacteria bacterium P01_D01_bin.44]